MISYLKGILVEKSLTKIVVEVSGLGYEISIPLSTYEKLNSKGEIVEILTYLHVREDLLQLFGFATEEERELFLQLLGISGIGPRTAIGILSGISVDKFKDAIMLEDIDTLTCIPGVGKKTASRILVELKDKFGKKKIGVEIKQKEQDEDIIREVTSGLVNLGISPQKARAAVEAVLRKEGKLLPLSELIRKALSEV